MGNQMDSIVDMLDKTALVAQAETSDNEEILVPRKCAYCKCNVICSVLPTLIGIYKIGIIVGVEECQYCVPGKNAQQDQNRTQDE